MKKNGIRNVLAVGIVLIFVFGAFAPAVISNSKSPISEEEHFQVNDSTLHPADKVVQDSSDQERFQVNDSTLHPTDKVVPDSSDQKNDLIQVDNNPRGGYGPLDTPQTFYDAVGRIYLKPTSYAQLVNWYNNLEQNYSGYIHVFKANELYNTGTIPKNGGGSYDLYYVRITNESRGFHKPEVFLSGGPHGDEKVGAIGLYWTLDWLMRHAFHPDYNCAEREYLQWLLDNREIYIEISHNPDGFDRNVRGDYLGRDLNREGDHDASYGPFNSVNGKTMMAFFNNHTIRTAIFYHTGARQLLYPWQNEHSSITGVSPISGTSYGHVPADFYFYDAAGLLLGDYIGDYGGDLNKNNIGSSYALGMGGPGCLDSWAYGGNNEKNPAEDPYVELGPHLGAGVFAWDPEAYGTGSPAQSYFGNDTVFRLGAEVRRLFTYTTDLAQPSVHWTNGTTQEYTEVETGETLDFSWLVHGCLVVDNTRIQYGTNPDPINNPMYFTSNVDDHQGDYYGGSYWDNALAGSSIPTTYNEEITFTTPGDYFIIAKAMVDQKYKDVFRPDHYGSNSYLRMINERTNGTFSESLLGTDGLEVINGQLWWYSPVLHVRVTSTGGEMAPWYNKNWTFRKEILINHTLVAGDLSSFPVLVDITDTDLASKAQGNGNDILFTDIYNNKLYHEIEYYASGHLVAWVNVPTVLSSMDTVLYMYYGNSTCESQENVSGVWDSHYMLIQHLSETSGIHYDSTGNNNDGTPHGGITQGSSGHIDGADVFDGINDYVQVPHNNTISGFTTGLTASAWIRLDGNSSWVTILNKYNTSNSQRGWQVYYDGSENPKRLHFVLATTATTFYSYLIPFNAAINTWYYITATWTSGQVPRIYVNGVAYTPTPTTTITSVYNNPLEPLYIGRAYIGGTSNGRFWDGSIDEVRISNIARSEAWVKTSYNNQFNPNNFITVGHEEGPIFIFNLSPENCSKGIPQSTSLLSFNITHLQGKSMDYTVETSPDIGSADGNGVYDGRYTVSISGLDDCTRYVWYVNVTDGVKSISRWYEFTTECQDPWWDANWHYRKKITIDSSMVISDLTDFPVLLSFFDSDVANKAQADGDDIAFADKNGVQLNHEIEQFKSSTLTAWVKIPTLLSSQDVYIYMYYGNAVTESQQNPSGVWDSNYMMVQHLSEASGTHYDSTSNDNDGSPMNGVIQQATGKIDGADEFDGTNDYVQVPHDDTLSGYTEAMTVSTWVKLQDTGSRQTILNKWETTGSQRSWALDFEREEGTDFGFFASASPGTSYVTYLYDCLILSNTWYYVTVVWQANQVAKMYVNGVQLSTTETATVSNLYNAPSAPLYIGRAYDVSPERYLDGVIDEVQISNVARSAAWITAAYRNQDNPISFIVLGAEESEHPLISDPLPVNGAISVGVLDVQLSFHLTDRQNDPMNYTVETSPDIGSDSANHVFNGRYYVNVGGLTYSTTYSWFVNATDGEHESRQIFTFTTQRAPIPWWNTTWSFRKEITLDHTKITGDLYNFPMRITLNDSDIAIKARKDGTDIVFADDSGNKLDYEIEYYQKGNLEAWVRIPYFSSTTDTTIMVYYGNHDAVNQENPAGVWDSHYMMVQHLSETAGTHYDSTGNDNDGTPYGGVIQGAIGQIDGADEFDGTNDYVQVPHKNTLSGFTVGMTVSAWVKFDTTTSRRAIISKYGTTSPQQRSWNVEYIISPSGALQFTASQNGSTTVYSYWYANVGTLSTNTWYYVTVGWHSNERPTFYLNGNKLSLTLSSGVNLTQLFNNVNTPLYIGRTYTTDRYWDGKLDEVCVSNINRSAAWIKTCYNNQVNPSVFYSLGSEEMGIAPNEPFLYDEEPLDESTLVPLNPTLSISVVDYQDDTVDVTFRTNASGGTWVTIGSLLGGGSTTYTQVTSTMNNYLTTYYWSVNCSDSYHHWSNKTYSFTTRQANYPPTLTNPSPGQGATGVAPVPSLSITVNDIDENLLTILFKSNYSGSWQTLDSLNDVPSGTYSFFPEEMNLKGKTYYWSVSCYDGIVWTNQTYHFTMSTTLLTLKWTGTFSSFEYGMVVAGDINGDGTAEIFITGSTSYCIDGKTGDIIWQKSVSGGAGQGLMADCNGDGILDLIVKIAASGIEVLYGNNGTTYWRTTGLGGSAMNKPVAFDIDGDGCSEVFYCSQEIGNGWNGSGRITSLTHDGRIVNQIFAYRPCAGGLSLADTNFDGQFELYMGDRHQSYSGDDGVPRGLRAFLIDEDGTIHCNWNRSDILMSSHAPIIADVNGDGKLDIICCHQVGGVWVIDSTTGATIRGAYTIYCSDGMRFPGHYQMGVCDIDGDGHLELLAADGTHPEPYTSDDVAVFDLVTWTEDALLPHICEMGPTTGDVTGDGKPDILISSFNGLHIYTWNYTNDSAQFLEQRTGLAGTLGPAVLADVDGDGYNELVVGASSGRIYVYDVPAPSPTPRPLSEIQFYSTYRNGQAIYTEPPGIKRPLLKEVYPANKSINFDLNPTLSVKVIDYQHDPINITISTNASGSWTQLASYTNMKTGQTYSVPCPLMSDTGMTYYWRVTATDGTHITTQTFKLTTYTQGAFTPGWQYRKKITLNQSQIQSDLANFPVLIDITDAQIGAKAKSNGDDLLFTGMDGQTILDYEIESYTNSNGHLIAWVKTNLAASNGTFIYLYYGNNAATSHENPEAVWDSHYMMVQHLSETSGTHYDSTVYSNDGSPLNGVIQNALGKIDGADIFDGTNDYINVPHNDSIAGFTEGLTASTWFKLDTVARRQTILCKYQTTGNQRGYYLDFVNSPAAFHLYASSDGIVGVYWTAAFTPVAGRWYYVAFTWAPNTIPKIYVDGQKIAVARTDTLPSIYNNNLEPLRLGNSYTTSRQIDGMLDEVRISDIARSSDWITTSYNNQNDPMNFSSIGAEEIPSEAPIISNENPRNNTLGVSPDLSVLRFDLSDAQGDLMNYTVTTIPDIGSDYVTGVSNGTYTLSLNGLAVSTKYTWSVHATDGTQWTNETYTFTTAFNLDAWKYWKKITVNKQQIDDNCRIYAILSDNLPNGLLKNHLIDAPNSLERLSAFTNIDGWGIGYYPEYSGIATISRGAQQANNDPEYDTVVQQINASEPKITLAHIRNCQNGCCCHGCYSIDDPHPFVRTKDGKTWTFVHNGVVHESIVRTLLGDYLDDNPLNCSGVCLDDQHCDSEMFFLLLLKYIENNSWHVTNGIVEGINTLVNAGETGGLNFVLSDGEKMWAFRRHQLSSHTLYFLNDMSGGYAAVASQYPSSTQGDWVEMEDYQLVQLSSHTEPLVIDVLNYTLVPDLEDFPVLIDIVDSDLASKAQVDGDDILFTDQHKNKLDHEIEFYNSTSGHLVAWVKLPHLFMNQEEDVYMFYGNQNAANQQNVSGVWNTHYMVVHHLEETSGALSDSTKHHNDGVPQNGVTLNIAGKIDGADAFDGTDDFISIPHNSTLDGAGTWSEMTMEAWIKADTSQNARIVLAKWGAASSRSYELGIDSAGNTQLFAAVDNGAYLETLYSDVTPLTPGTWYYVTSTYEDGNLNLYINGVLDANRSNTGGNIKASSDSLKIGARNPTPERFFDGSIDEVRISDVARSSNWTLLSYRNQNNMSMFISVGPEEGQNIILSGEYPVNGATDIPLSPILEISITHTKGYLMNITWKTNASGSWTVIGTNTYTGNNTYHCTNTHSMNNNNKMYYWSVQVNDGHGNWLNKTYSFKTKVSFVNSAPVTSTPYPENGSTGVVKPPAFFHIAISDANADTMNITWQENETTGSWKTYNTTINKNNGTYYAYNTSWIALYNHKYWWRVQVNDGNGGWTNQTYSFTTLSSAVLLVDSEFNNNYDSIDLRANNPGQDWYESRGGFTGGDATLLTLDTNNIGGNTGKKAGLKSFGYSTTHNAYCTQEFSSPQSGTFNVSFDIYIDRIEDAADYDRTGHIFIGDNSVTTNAPTGTSNERFVFLAFYDPTPGDTGNDLEIRARTLSTQVFATTSQWVQVTSGLSYDTWMTVKLVVKVGSGTYDVYVNGVLKMANVPKYAGYTTASVVYMTFDADGDGRGDYYVDNVFAPSVQRYTLHTTTVGNGSVTVSPGESTYAKDATVTLTAVADPGWTFTGWSGNLSGHTNPKSITMDSDKNVIATFSTALDIHITNLTGQWNFVSAPYNQTINKTDLTIVSGGTEYTWTDATTAGIILGFCYEWNRATQSYQLSDSLKLGQGYWLYAYSPCELWLMNAEVIDPDTYITALSAQWNVVGVPSEESIGQENLIIQYNGAEYNWSQATTSNNPTGSPLILGFIYNWTRSSQAYMLSNTLIPGYAYWMYSYHTCILKRGS